MKRFEFSENHRAEMENIKIPFAVYEFIDLRVVTLVLSSGFLEEFGYVDKEEAYREMDFDMYKEVHPDDAARIADAAYKFATEGGEYNIIYRSKKKGGGPYHIIHAIGKHVFTNNGRRLAYVWYTDEGVYNEGDSSPENAFKLSLERELHEESLFKEGYFDNLTGLPNMSYFFDLVNTKKATLSERGQNFSILFFDLSGMKFYNSRHGFAEGDKVIYAFSKYLAGLFGNENCSRFGQDHFAVYHEGDNVENELDALFEEWQKRDEHHPVIRVGICEQKMCGSEVSTACDRAKIACDSIRNTYVSAFRYFNEDLMDEIGHRQYIIENIDKAIKEKRIQVYYQPIIRAVSGRVCDEEALARWIDPERGFMSPADFIPILEESGLIYKLDLYVVEQVLEKLKIQKNEGLHVVPQSINLSRADFDSCDVVEEIRSRVDKAGIERKYITIEITESVIGRDFEFMKSQISRFQKLGFDVWMDDFGSGYSSPDVLQRIKFQLIKFDMKFMQEFREENESGKIILTELMKMATGLGVDTVCEGVETEEQVKFLREIGCSKLQGYYYLKPISFDELLLRYREGRQIGFEDPAQSGYYEIVGRVNLHDLTDLSGDDEDGLNKFFNTFPMAIMEINGNDLRLARSNSMYQKFISDRFGFDVSQGNTEYSDMVETLNAEIMTLIKKCCEKDDRLFYDCMLPDGSTVHFFSKRVGKNAVTGTIAVAVAVLSIMNYDEGASFANIASALASDYVRVYYIDLQTENFVSYASEVGEDTLVEEKRGENFFAECVRIAKQTMTESDAESFLASFGKDYVINSIKEHGRFNLIYRRLVNGEPTYFNMKAKHMTKDGRYMIIAVSNVDAQMRRKEKRDRIRDEKNAFSRLVALSGNYVAMYSVDLLSGRYTAFQTTGDCNDLKLSKSGDDFFEVGKIKFEKLVEPSDLKTFSERFTKENVLKDIKEKGFFEMRYHFLIDGASVPLESKAVLVNEDGTEKIIVGIKKC